MSYTLLGGDGRPYESAEKGQWGGHRRTKIYGRLDCPSALRAIARGGYARQRVFFADEATAIAAGYRPCATCCKDRYDAWRASAHLPSSPCCAPDYRAATVSESTPAAVSCLGGVADKP
jgi:methylphosphotriester-DNA--protein-cysteine methyltransferase